MSDRNAAKKKRAAQNKAARDALAARRTKAAQDRPRDRASDSDSDNDNDGDGARPARAWRRSSSVKGASDEGTVRRPSRTAGARPSREATPRREPKTSLGRVLAGVQEVPGGRAVLFGFLFSIVAAGMLLFAPIAPRSVQVVPSRIINKVRVENNQTVSEAAKDTLENPRFESTYLTAIIGPAAVVVVVPVLIAGTAVVLARRPNRARIFTFAAVAQVLSVLLLSSLGIFFLFSAGGLGYGAYKARKADGPPARGSWRRPSRSSQEASEDAPDEEDLTPDPDDDSVR